MRAVNSALLWTPSFAYMRFVIDETVFVVSPSDAATFGRDSPAASRLATSSSRFDSFPSGDLRRYSSSWARPPASHTPIAGMICGG